MRNGIHRPLSTARFLQVWLISLLLLGGCSTEQPPLSIGTNIWPGYEPLYLAQAQGLIDPRQIHLVEYTSASQVMNAFRNGVIQAASLTLDEVLLLQAEGLKPKIVLVMDISNGGDVILGQPGITRMQQLRGKKVGVENTALGAYVISRALQINGMKESDIDMVPVELHQHKAYFIDQRIDALVTFEPYRSILLQHDAQILFSSRQIANEIVDVLVVNAEVLQEQQNTIATLIDAWYHAVAQIEQRRPAEMQIINRRLQLDETSLAHAFDGLIFPNRELNQTLIHSGTPGLLATSKQLAATMLEKHLITDLPNPEHLFTDAEDIKI